jgi:N-acetylglucosaminyldiphosphoundecaprenol N-acetyl-beta-D-mannosaminyltransferase
MLYANGIGPITKNRNIPRAGKALRNCDIITLRDKESYDELAKLGVSRDAALLSSDPSLTITPASESRLDEIYNIEGLSKDKCYIALSFKEWKYNMPDFLPTVGGVIADICKEYGLTPLFIPMQYPHDSNYCLEMSKHIGISESVIIKHEYTASELMAVIDRCKLVISMRLHTLIYAACVAKPMFGLVYDPKVRAFMEYIGQTQYLHTDNVDCAEMRRMIDNIMENYNDISVDIESKTSELKQLSYNDAKLAVSLLNI